MTRYVLDTDMLTLYAQGDAAVGRRVREHPADEVAITVLTVEEQLSGWYAQVRKAKDAQRLARAYYELARSVHLLGRLPVLLYSEMRYGATQTSESKKSGSVEPTFALPPLSWNTEPPWSRATFTTSAECPGYRLRTGANSLFDSESQNAKPTR